MLVDRRLIERTVKRAAASASPPARIVAPSGDGPRPTSEVQRRNRFRTLLAETGRADYARDAMERIIGGNDLVSINYLERGMRSARAVCRIRLRNAAVEPASTSSESPSSATP